MAKKNLTGKASYFKLDGTKIYITKYGPKFSKTRVDTTDSADYDEATDLVWKTQLYAGAQVELSVEGKYDLNGNTALLTAKLLAGGAPASAVQLGLDAGSLLGSGNFDVDGFEVESVIEGEVTYKATLVSNGPFTPGA